MDIDELAYWYWLTDVKGIGPVISKRLLDSFQSPIHIFRATAEEITEMSGIRKNIASNIIRAKENINRYRHLAEGQIKIANLVGGRIITSNDPYYTSFYSKHEGEKALPALIHVLGNGAMPNTGCYAIIGTRRPSADGSSKASELAANLAKQGITIVSGLALGIDAQAHRGTLDAGGTTIAILGCGADIQYPNANSDLYTRILEKGLIISEFPFGVRPSSVNLRKRNRTIVSFSDGVIIAECPIKSGAMIAARFAAQQKKPLFSFKYDNSIDNSGGDWLISRQLAVEIQQRSYESILEASRRFVPLAATNVDKIFQEIWPRRIIPKAPKTKSTRKKGERTARSRDGKTLKGELDKTQLQLPMVPDRKTSTDDLTGEFEYKVGDEVIHPSFGRGRIINISEVKDDYQVTIEFPPRKTKTFLWKYTTLTRE